MSAHTCTANFLHKDALLFYSQYVKISAMHLTALTLNFVLFKETLQFLGHFSIPPLIDKINICCGYSFS